MRIGMELGIRLRLKPGIELTFGMGLGLRNDFGEEHGDGQGVETSWAIQVVTTDLGRA